MFERSVLRTSGQWPRALAAFWGVITGGVVAFVGVLRLQPAGGTGLLLLAGGFVLVIAGALFAIAGIRCPRCNAHWVWMAMRGQGSNQWLAWLLSAGKCPACGFGVTSTPATRNSGATSEEGTR